MRDHRGRCLIEIDPILLEFWILRRWGFARRQAFGVLQLMRNLGGILGLHSAVKGVFSLISGGGRWLAKDETANCQSADNTGG